MEILTHRRHRFGHFTQHMKLDSETNKLIHNSGAVLCDAPCSRACAQTKLDDSFSSQPPLLRRLARVTSKVPRTRNEEAHPPLRGLSSSAAVQASLVPNTVDLLTHELQSHRRVSLAGVGLDRENLALPDVEHVRILSRQSNTRPRGGAGRRENQAQFSRGAAENADYATGTSFTRQGSNNAIQAGRAGSQRNLVVPGQQNIKIGSAIAQSHRSGPTKYERMKVAGDNNPWQHTTHCRHTRTG